MREALLAVDPEEAEHFKVTKEAFQCVDIKKKDGAKRLREVVERNLEADRASPKKSTPSWVHELVPTKHEGVAKIHQESVERKGTWTVRYEVEDSFDVPVDLQTSQRKAASTQSGQLSESWLFGRGRSSNAFFWRVSAGAPSSSGRSPGSSSSDTSSSSSG